MFEKMNTTTREDHREIIVLKRKPRFRSGQAGENFRGIVKAYGLLWLQCTVDICGQKGKKEIS